MSNLLSLPEFDTFGEFLRHLRRRARLTQRDLGQAVGYSEAHITRLENGQRLPDLTAVKGLFVEALDLKHKPELAKRLVELATKARGDTPLVAVQDHAKARANLPAQLTSFIGREREIAEVKELLGTTRLLTLIGAGGVGKTRLAQEAAACLLSTFADGVWYVELAALADSVLVLQTVAATLKLIEQPGCAPLDAVADYFEAKQSLLVLDNCEHLIAACADLAVRLLQRCAGLRILATSRETLHIPGEVVYRVPSLTTPPLAYEASDLSDYESVRLFIERARVVQPEFDLTPSHIAEVAQVCRRLDGIPLALELAAARLQVLSIGQIAERLDDRFSLLTSGTRTAPPRQQTLRATIAWSVELLTPAERDMLARLSVFAGGFTAEAAEAIFEQPNTLDLLSGLVDKSLVIVDMRGEQARYRMLETIRQFAYEALRASAIDTDEEHVLRRRHLAFFLVLAEKAEPELICLRTSQWLDQLDAELDNLRAAMDWAFANGEAASGLRLIGALEYYWVHRSFRHEQCELLAKALAMSNPSERTSLRAKVLNQAAYTQWFLRHFGEAHALVDEALSIAVEMGDLRNIAEAFHCLQFEAFTQKNFAEAYSLNEQALAIWHGLGDRFKIARALCYQAELSRYQDGYDYDRARNHYEEAVGLLTELDEKPRRSMALHRLGRMMLRQGNFTKAAAQCEQGLRLSLEAGVGLTPVSCLLTIGGIAVACSQSIRAARLFGAAEALLHRYDMQVRFSDVYDYEEDLRALRGQLDESKLNTAWAEGRAMTLEQAVDYALADSKD